MGKTFKDKYKKRKGEKNYEYDVEVAQAKKSHKKRLKEKKYKKLEENEKNE